MANRPRRAAAALTSYDEDALASNSARKRKATEELIELENPAVSSKKRATKTTNPGSLEWILTSNKSPLTSLPLDVSVGGLTSSVGSPLRPSYRE